MKSISELTKYLIPLIGPKCSYQFADLTYSLPAKEWFLDAFPKALGQFQSALGVDSYKDESNDCDNFAKIASSFADILHVNSKGAGGIAIGEFWYSDINKGPHAINFAVYKTPNDNLGILFLEPQNSKQIYLTEKEIKSCYLLKM